MNKIRVGIIGLGIGKKHLEAYEEHDKAQVVALCDLDENTLKDVGNDHPGIMLTNDAHELITHKDVDLVSIASYDNYHYEHVIRSIKCGKHVFVEKPLCLYEEEAAKIRKALRKKPQVRLSSNLVLRTCPRFDAIRNMIRSKECGDIYYIEADYLWGRIDKLLNGWRKDMPYYSIILGAALHMVDLVMWLIDKKPIEVVGYGNPIATKNASMKYNDFGVFLLKFDTGLIVKIGAHGGCMHPHYHNVVVYGTKKTIAHSIQGGFVIDSQEPEAQITPLNDDYPGRSYRKRVIHTFLDSLIDPSKQPLVSCEDVFNGISVCFAAERSITKNKPQTIAYI